MDPLPPPSLRLLPSQHLKTVVDRSVSLLTNFLSTLLSLGVFTTKKDCITHPRSHQYSLGHFVLNNRRRIQQIKIKNLLAILIPTKTKE